MAKKIELYTVRNSAGQFLGQYRATSPEAAVRKFRDGQMVYAATFRKSHGVKFMGETAKVEET